MAGIFDDIRSAFNRKDNAVVRLILINIFVFAGLLIVGFFLSFSDATKTINAFIQKQFVLAAPLQEFILRPWSLLTYSFSHETFLHILFNMINFYWFGTLLQDFIGNQKVTNIYLIGGILGGLIYILVHNFLALAPESYGIHNISPAISGASVAVFAIMFATITLVPEYEFYFFRLFLIKIKYVAWAFLLFSFLIPSNGVSHAAGAFIGYSYIKLLRMGIDMGSPLEAISRWWTSIGRKKAQSSPSEKRFSKSPVYMSSSSKNTPSSNYYPAQEEVDAILDKIGKSGYESLSKEEKELLFRASQKD